MRPERLLRERLRNDRLFEELGLLLRERLECEELGLLFDDLLDEELRGVLEDLLPEDDLLEDDERGFDDELFGLEDMLLDERFELLVDLLDFESDIFPPIMLRFSRAAAP